MPGTDSSRNMEADSGAALASAALAAEALDTVAREDENPATASARVAPAAASA